MSETLTAEIERALIAYGTAERYDRRDTVRSTRSALVKAIAAYGASERRKALEEAAKLIEGERCYLLGRRETAALVRSLAARGETSNG